MAETKKRAPAWLISHKELQDGGDGFKQIGSKSKNCHILGEIDEDVWLIYSHGDHSFATWHAGTN